MANLYFKEGLDSAWENPLNWWLNSAATTPALNAPWVDSSPQYLAYNLTTATGATINPTIGVAIGTGATGTCDIDYVENQGGTVNDGTFTGDNFRNFGTINDGTFTGDNFGNFGTINDGTFTGDGFTNYYLSLSSGILGGTFSGNGFTNSGSAISGGTFSGSGFTNYYAAIYGGTFSGNGFTNNGGFIVDGTFTGDNFGNIGDFIDGQINGGTFTGDNFVNDHGIINGGTFSGDGFTNSIGIISGGTFIPTAVSVTTSGVNTLLSMNGGPTFGYPTPPSGGNDQMIARLLNLPWFINL